LATIWTKVCGLLFWSPYRPVCLPTYNPNYASSKPEVSEALTANRWVSRCNARQHMHCWARYRPSVYPSVRLSRSHGWISQNFWMKRIPQKLDWWRYTDFNRFWLIHSWQTDGRTKAYSALRIILSCAKTVRIIKFSPYSSPRPVDFAG